MPGPVTVLPPPPTTGQEISLWEQLPPSQCKRLLWLLSQMLERRLSERPCTREVDGNEHRTYDSLAVLALMGGARSMSDISRFAKLRPEVLDGLGLRVYLTNYGSSGNI